MALVEDVRDLQGVMSDDVAKCLKDLQYWKSSHTYKVPGSPEEGFTRPNLDSVMQSIVHRIPDNDKKYRFKVESSNAIRTKIPFIFAKPSSLSEPVVTFQWDNTSVGLIASEAKALDASMLMAYAQAVQVASDCAVNLGRLFAESISTEDVIVPFITTSWNDVQFGAVCLMDNFYPSAVLLSSRLSLNCNADLRQICYWVIALARHCTRVGDMLKPLCDQEPDQSMTSEVQSSSSSVTKRAKLDPDANASLRAFSLGYCTTGTPLVSLPGNMRYFFKPITLTSGDHPESFRALLSGLMSRFYDMYHCSEALREIVVFPDGVLAYPDDIQEDMCEFLQAEFSSLLRLKGIPSHLSADLLARHSTVGYPVVVYPRLDPEWTRGDALLHEPSDAVVHLFIKAVTEACGLFVTAGIVHMDLRLCNIFYRVEAGVDGSATAVHIRVIDWDDSVRLYQYVPEEFLECTRLNRTFPRQLVASPEYHDFFIRSLTEELSSRTPIFHVLE